LLHKNWSLYDVEHVVFSPKQMSAERLQEGLFWAWKQSYRWGSIARRALGAPPSIWALWASLNYGYRYYAKYLAQKIGPEIYRDPKYVAGLNSGLSSDGPELTALVGAGEPNA
jgi:hypothetical protein